MDPACAKLQILAYDRISAFLQLHQDQVVEVEILPPSLEPEDGLLMQEGINLGLPKKVLVLAFVEARKRFFDSFRREGEHDIAYQASRIVLLCNSEHLTAANYRKTRLVKLRADASEQGVLKCVQAVKHELLFVQSILTSPLHRQSKSPTLWYHRLWVLQHARSVLLDPQMTKQREEFFHHELDAVCRSGERHPKNYYAWQYARRLMDYSQSKSDVSDYASKVKDWCFRHPSDISGWTFLGYTLISTENVTDGFDIMKEVLDYAIKLQSRHESLWTFIRTMLAHEVMQAQQRELVRQLQEYEIALKNKQHPEGESKLVSQALTWIIKHNTETRSSQAPSQN